MNAADRKLTPADIRRRCAGFRGLAASVVLSLTVAAGLAAPPVAPPSKPRLLLLVVVDQLRYDYLLQFRADYKSGFARLLQRGAVFTSAHYLHASTNTAPGHATLLSGAPPSVSGIIDDDWYDRATGQHTTAVFSPGTKLVGGLDDDVGSSPFRMLVGTIPDELKTRSSKSKAIGVSWKDRAAILAVGRSADAAYWFDIHTNHWVTGSYYRDKLPGWLEALNGEKPFDRYRNAVWRGLGAPETAKPFCSVAAREGIPECWLPGTPWSNEMLEELAERAIAGEALGSHSGTDTLSVSFSANDYVGHDVGPEHPEMRDMCIRTDQLLGRLLDYVDKRIGPGKTLIVLTSDHGVAPLPEANQARHMPGGRLSEKGLAQVITNALTARYGPGKWVLPGPPLTPYLNLDLIGSRKLDRSEVERVASDALRATPHIARVYTRHELLHNLAQQDSIQREISLGFYGPNSGDLFIVPDPYWVIGDSGTSHGSPYTYDTHVPIIFSGEGIKPGFYTASVAVNDIAPTLAVLLGVEEPCGSIGRVLNEIFSSTMVNR